MVILGLNVAAIMALAGYFTYKDTQRAQVGDARLHTALRAHVDSTKVHHCTGGCVRGHPEQRVQEGGWLVGHHWCCNPPVAVFKAVAGYLIY